jgi:hypothetical protein
VQHRLVSDQQQNKLDVPAGCIPPFCKSSGHKKGTVIMTKVYSLFAAVLLTAVQFTATLA